jgi:putative cardiolipin synthase
MTNALERGLQAALLLGMSLVLAPGCVSQPDRALHVAESLSRTTGQQREDGAYRQNLATLIARDGLSRLDKTARLWAKDRGGNPDDAPDASLERKLKGLARPSQAEPASARAKGREARKRFQADWRKSTQTLFIAPSGPDSGPAIFSFSGLSALESEIVLAIADGRPRKMVLTCDGQIEVSGWPLRKKHGPGETFTIAFPGTGKSARPVRLYPQEGLNRCVGSLAFAHSSRPLTIQREEWARPELGAFDGRFDICPMPDGNGLKPLERVFHEPRWLSQTCPFPIGRPELLEDGRAGFDAKVEALLGMKLPEDFYRKQDPELALDFSRAPKLSLIYASYLDIKADFSGRVFERLLRHHAKHGTTIRIIASDVLERKKDRALLEKLAADYPNIQYKAFSWRPPKGAALGETLSRFHKVHHTKMLMTLSTRPGRSVVIMGGRNIHDGFLFHEPLDLSRYPELQQYGETNGLSLNYYANWDDFDLLIRDETVVRMLGSHLSTLWHDDVETWVSRPFTISTAGRAAQRGNARHFISVPYTDGRALEAYYVGLIDVAEKTIEIVNPYLHLTPALAAAVERALGRGVKITIIGRIDMDGDIGAAALTALNRMFVNQYADRISIYDFKSEHTVLHSKILMIDGRLVTVSSVNLNHRSFVHDNENGISVLDQQFYKRMKAIFEQYRAESRPVAPKDISVGWRLLFSSKMIREAF